MTVYMIIFLKITKSRRVRRISYFSGSEIALNGGEKNLKTRRRAHNGVLRDRRSPGVTTESVEALLDSLVESSFLRSYLEMRLAWEYPICNLRLKKTTCASSDSAKRCWLGPNAEPC